MIMKWDLGRKSNKQGNLTCPNKMLQFNTKYKNKYRKKIIAIGLQKMNIIFKTKAKQWE